MLIRDPMTRDRVTVRPETSVEEIVSLPLPDLVNPLKGENREGRELTCSRPC